MGLMAVQAAHLVNERPVYPVFIKCVIHHRAVAAPAQLKPCLLGVQRVRRSGCLVALCTRLIGDRSVDIIEQDSGPTRSVGVMAGATVRLRNGIIHMLPQKTWSICRVTADAERHQVFFQKAVRFRRGMGVVAVHAPFLDWVMFKFNFCNRIANILMAIKTEFVRRLQKNELVF